jgi:hypothetical protein
MIYPNMIDANLLPVGWQYAGSIETYPIGGCSLASCSQKGYSHTPSLIFKVVTMCKSERPTKRSQKPSHQTRPLEQYSEHPKSRFWDRNGYKAENETKWGKSSLKVKRK